MKGLQDGGVHVLRPDQLSRPHREALARNGFIRPIIRGWYMPASPSDEPRETTAWYASALEFVGRCCQARFGDAWCMSPDFSIRLHVGDNVLPAQVMVHAPNGQNTVLPLPAGHSLFDYRAKDFPAGGMADPSGVRAMPLETALVRVPESFFRTHARDAQAALLSLRDTSTLNRLLLADGRSVAAGRLAGALRACGRAELADDVLGVMKRAGHDVRETNPFDAPLPVLRSVRGEAAYVTRIRLTWIAMREKVIELFPAPPGKPRSSRTYLSEVRDTYVRDACNSLSIEGCRVTPELIERVASGQWSPAANTGDASSRDAMAARGYYLARRAVEASLGRILAGENPGRVAAADHRAWFGELFRPSVKAGILQDDHLAGCRGHAAFIKNAAHVPPPVEAVRGLMPALFDLLELEPHPGVGAVLGHFVFVYVHPYMDGNGRMGRFLMNAMLASGGYPWTVIGAARRDEYMLALDAASAQGDIGPFAAFIADCVAQETRLRQAT
ncbi:MAG TPA: Fic family protein [Rubrivivax sp.]|nr:Fic family protein [Rubrivivax sp.]